MIIARTSLLAPSAPAEQLTVQMAGDLLWLHVTPADQVEHLRVQAAAHGFDIVWFMLDHDRLKARAIALRICRDAIAASPAMAYWRAV